MSKLYLKYSNLKQKDPNKLYLFKNGIFYITLSEDAKILSNLFNLKLTNLNENILKCGFPTHRLEYYLKLLEENQISFEIIDENYEKIENYQDYLNNLNLKAITDKILSIDFDNITYKQAYEILQEIHAQIQDLYHPGGDSNHGRNQ